MEILFENPNPKEYLDLLSQTDLMVRVRSVDDVEFKNNIFSIIIRKDGNLIGMGRLIKINSQNYQLADIAVKPAFQNLGLGSLLMKNIVNFIENNINYKQAAVYLIAGKELESFYNKFNFKNISPGFSWYMEYTKDI